VYYKVLKSIDKFGKSPHSFPLIFNIEVANKERIVIIILLLNHLSTDGIFVKVKYSRLDQGIELLFAEFLRIVDGILLKIVNCDNILLFIYKHLNVIIGILKYN